MIYIDIETNLAHDTIWCCVTKKDGHTTLWTGPEGLQQYLKGHEVCAHNLIGFDAPVLRKVWDVTVPVNKAVDTLVISRLLNPQLDGGHSLKAWGKRLCFDKMDFDVEDFDGGLTEEMVEYCKRDVDVLEMLHKHLQNELKTWKDNGKQSLELEHKVAMYMAQQERNGFMLDQRLTTDLLAKMRDRMMDITINLQEVFPPLIHERYSEKTGKRLKDKVEEFNVGSRKQIASRLQSLGVVFTKTTEKGSIIVDEATLKGINRPEAQLIAEYLMLQKRVGMLDSWLDHCKDDGRVHGRVISNGAVTGRMTHQSPNMGQITSVKSEYGKESRQCWIVPKGYKLVGTDLSGIELRCLAHYMQDEAYTHELLDGDIHTANQKAAGLETRDQAKTFIYALLYGAGPSKIGSIVGGSSKQGQALIDKFMGNMPALDKLLRTVKRLAGKGYVPALDGRHIHIRSEHAALNSLLQSAGAIIAKQWCIEAHRLLRQAEIEYKQVAFVHDEIQLEVREDQAEHASVCMIAAAQLAGITLGFRVPVDAESKIGLTWYDTH
jgi:DNA polymerase I-like protein with 3'-5' exonuclease and polymerase domains